jgi:hypothetical protein
MRFFLAGIMQGSLTEAALHGQEYRSHLKRLIEAHFPEAEVYDPLAEHAGSIDYDDARGREVFFGHNLMCREVDVLIAFVPEASMGTAIEMWEAYQHGAAVVAISRWSTTGPSSSSATRFFRRSKPARRQSPAEACER